MVCYAPVALAYREGGDRMGKHADRSRQRMANYLEARQGLKLEAVNLNDRAYSSGNIRSMWNPITGTPRIVGKSMRMWYYNGRKHAHPAFTGRSGRVRTVGVPVDR